MPWLIMVFECDVVSLQYVLCSSFPFYVMESLVFSEVISFVDIHDRMLVTPVVVRNSYHGIFFIHSVAVS